MDLELLGQEIQLSREKAGLSPNQFASRLGWRGPTPVHRIERGESKPNAETLERISRVLDFTLAQYLYYLGLAGYLPVTYLPKKSMLIPILEDIIREMEGDANPSVLRDYKHVIWGINEPMMGFMQRIGYAREQIVGWMKNTTSSLDGIWGGISAQDDIHENIHEFLQQQIDLFKFHNVYRQHEPFYKQYPDKIKHKRFQTAWAENDNVSNGGLSKLREWQDYRRIIEHVTGLSYRFHVVRYVPNGQTPFESRKSQDKAIRLWDVAKITDDQLRAWSET